MDSRYFSSSYEQARRKFLAAAVAAGLPTSEHLHPLRGRDGEALAIDVAIDGDPRADRRLLLSSGCHGVEGFAGSAVQAAALTDETLRAQARAAGVTLVHLHALNPHGFSYLRRTTEDNVDLNRNFHDFTRDLPVNEPYRRVHPLLVPAHWPPPPENEAALMAMMQADGVRALQAVVARGQHEHPDGLFYGGLQPCWSNLTLRKVLRQAGAGAKRLGWIDLHTGLGPPGIGERILACENGAAAARARAWWGSGVTSVDDGSSTSTVVTGPLWTAARDECPQAEYTGIALEYGTVPVLQVLQALRADNWLHVHGRGGAGQQAQETRAMGEHAGKEAGKEGAREEAAWEEARRQMMQAFFVDDDEWQAQVLAQAREAISQAIAGLAGSA